MAHSHTATHNRRKQLPPPAEPDEPIPHLPAIPDSNCRLCGPRPHPEPHTRPQVINVRAVPIKYYAVAILFILFDLETMFLFIWALGAQPVTGFMLFTFFFFTMLLVLGLLYVYKARLLEAVTE